MIRHPEEISAWSIEELEAEIAVLLPVGWACRSQQEEGYWIVRVDRPSEGPEKATEVEREGPDKRLVLLDVYGTLWLRDTPPPPDDSPWVRRHDPTVATVTRRVQGAQIPDPEDLDPAEIAKLHQSRK